VDSRIVRGAAEWSHAFMVAMDAGPGIELVESDYDAALPATPASVPELRHAVVALARELGAEDEACDAVGVAVSEACTNVVMHAYEPDDPSGRIVLAARPDDDRLRVVVRDSGCGMRPRADSPGLGLGLPLIAQLSQRMEVTSGPGGRGTELRLWFSL
jgi:serine/threonine-protein kinase RsbW